MAANDHDGGNEISQWPSSSSSHAVGQYNIPIPDSILCVFVSHGYPNLNIYLYLILIVTPRLILIVHPSDCPFYPVPDFILFNLI